MIAFNRRTHIYVAKGPTDMRESYDILFQKVKTVLSKDPFSGHLFVFLNARRSSCKCLYYDGTGLVIIAKHWVEGFNSPRGHWLTRNKIKDPLKELALPHSGPYREQEWIIPIGTEILEGMAAPNFKQPGGAGQIFLLDPGVLR